jgi:hypothetical protein
MQTEKTADQLSRNFLVASIQRRMFARSTIGMVFVNKEYVDEPAQQQFNRIAGIDYNLASSDNKWTGKIFYHRSFGPDNQDRQFAQGSSLAFNSRQVHAAVSQASVGENYVAESGYVPRTGYNLINPEFGFLWLPNKRVISHGISTTANYYFDFSRQQLEHKYKLTYKFEFRDRSIFDIAIKDEYIKLENDFDPTHISTATLAAGTEYNTKTGLVNYHSDTRKAFYFWLSGARGGFYNGNIGQIQAQITYRYQPYLNMSLNISYNDINLPEPFQRSQFWLLGPKFDLTMSDKVFFSSYVQYNEQIDNMNVNLRFQWRYKPVSDLFIVYTDNYYTGNWAPRNRALVVKLSYWFN